MPGTYTGCGVTLMYPDNWTINEQVDGPPGEPSTVTIETPEGAFFSISRYPSATNPQEVIDRAVEAMREEYREHQMEVEQCGALSSNPGATAIVNELLEAGADISFYFLDLLITVRLLAIVHQGDVLLIQLQGESRDFDKQELVFSAMMQSMRNSLMG